MDSKSSSSQVRPRIIIHGGAGNITRKNLSPQNYEIYRTTLLSILRKSYALLQTPGATALDVATAAVTQLENNPLFNSGHGAVYTTHGSHELEASVMVSRGSVKRGVGLMRMNHVKNPIRAAREMLLRGQDADGGGARGHCQLEGEELEKLARDWGCEMVEPSYFWTKKRWDEHRRGLGLSTGRDEYEEGKRKAGEHKCESEEDLVRQAWSDHAAPSDPSWDGDEYLPQGTVGCVVLDGTGTLCVATSTGGITNKVPGRIGDTPTLGAGFWAEEWTQENPFDTPRGLNYQSLPSRPQIQSPLTQLLGGQVRDVLTDCLPQLSTYLPLPAQTEDETEKSSAITLPHGVAMSGTGNGDSFLRLSAVRTAAAMTRFSSSPLPLQWSVSRVAGPQGMLQQSAAERWHKTGEGEGGIIGIELRHGRGHICYDFNCGGMFRTWIDDHGAERMMVFHDEY